MKTADEPTKSLRGRQEQQPPQTTDNASPEEGMGICATASSNTAIKCPTHNDYPLSMFCLTHRAPCCTKCCLDGHRKCSSTPLSGEEGCGVVAEILQSLAADVDTLEEKISALTSATLAARLEEKHDELVDRARVLRAEIEEVFLGIREAIDEREASLLKELEGLYEQASTAIISSIPRDVEKTLDVVAAGREALSWKEKGDWVRRVESVVRACEVHNEIALVDGLMCRASAALKKGIPKIEFEYDRDVLAGLKTFGCVKAVKNARKIVVQNCEWNRITFKLDAELCDLDGTAWDYEVEVKKACADSEEYVKLRDGEKKKRVWEVKNLLADTDYSFRVKAREPGGGEWSEEVLARTANTEPLFKECCWRTCSDSTRCSDDLKYHVDKGNPRIATKVLDDEFFFCTIPGTTPIPLGRVTQWGVKIVRSESNNGDGISVGVAPADINVCDDDNYEKCGWYLDCFNGTLTSGPPHNYEYPGKRYGTGEGEMESVWRVRTNSIVYVVMDTREGELSFVVNDVNYGTAYTGIPLDKPLVPCVILGCREDCVELV